MPPRLQDRLSVSLIQWMRTACADETRSVTVRISESESMPQIEQLLKNAGMVDIVPLTMTSLRGTVTADDLSRVARCLGVCSVTASRGE